MDRRLKKLIKENNLKLFYRNLELDGYLVHTPSNYPNLMVVKEGLSDRQIERVILHEIGHSTSDCNVVGNYKSNPVTRIRSENEANKFLIHEQVKEYINLGNDLITANYVDLAKSLGTNNYWLVRDELSKYKIN